MAYNVKSKEFADAWRIVSEALLAMIQQGEFTLPTQLSTDSTQESSTTNKPAAVDAPTNEIPASAVEVLCSRTPVETLYSAVPQKNEDGSYSFKRMKDERNKLFYRIFVYEDDTCEFELCPEIAGESENLQNLRDSASGSMPNTVCKVVGGSLDSDVNSIKTIRRGKGHKTGRFSCAIDSPCEVAIS